MGRPPPRAPLFPYTTLFRSNDIGRQYRSAVFFADEDQRRVAEAYIRQLADAKVFSSPIVTTLEPLEQFFEAEDRKSTRLNSSHSQTSYAVFCLKKKTYNTPH